MSGCSPRLVLLGKQGAGKGTQADRLAQHYGITHVSTGDLFRASAQEGSPLGLKVAQYLETGDLVPDEIVIEVVEAQLAEQDVMNSGFILDGFPRTLPQAEALEGVLSEHPLDLVVDLDVPTEIVLYRIAGRRVCVDCATNYHLDHPPVAVGATGAWICDVCGGNVVQREDDAEESVMRRLELYELQTLPLIHFYRRRGRLAHVDGTGDSEHVYETIVRVIDRRLEDGRS
jgi:adenylate kinase